MIDQNTHENAANTKQGYCNHYMIRKDEQETGKTVIIRIK